ncbi:MAG: polysaccharide biosynthesis protein [Oscillospiraceae bacterium]|nr:polysaccharide biosynthesis protein [Oscillospiraceae bacterium]
MGKHSEFFKLTARILSLVLVDILMVFGAMWLALYARFDFSFSDISAEAFFSHLGVYGLVLSFIAVAVYIPLKLYNSLWEFAGVEELLHIGFASLIICVVEMVVVGYGFLGLPRSFPILHVLFLAMFTCTSRFSYRLVRNLLKSLRKNHNSKNTMLIGAGEAGSMVLREFQKSIQSRNHVVCIVDDDASKHGKYIHNVKVAGDRHSIPKLVQDYHVEEIVFAIPTAGMKDRKDILDICKTTGCRMKILPGVFQLANGEVHIQKIRDVDVLDLLGRDSVQVDISQIADYIGGRSVLVTGGGGSIGSELCRQIAKLNPARLVIFDIYENNAYDIQQELRRNYPELKVYAQIGSVRDEKRVDLLFKTFRPAIVFHAAAHKHVPLMEDSPNEAIKNNVFGTYHVAEAANRYGTKTFVLISTDKAVNPTNIMGASKRICEMIVQTMAELSETRFVAVRFGNVLGSNGSVIPLFKKQIEAGGPVTVTHKDIIRFFMTIPEAVSLVLQAGAYADRGEIFVLDMGEPVRIDDLARNLIRLSGFEPDVDIEVKYTGLRPGEKLYEEILMSEEGLRNTANDMIHIGSPLQIDQKVFLRQLQELQTACEDNYVDIRRLVYEIVPTYKIPADVK